MTAATVSETYLLDVNVLIALAWPAHVHHGRAHAWFDGLSEAWATTPITESAFVRLSTNPAVVGDRVPVSQAITVLGAIRALPRHVFIADDSSLSTPAVALDRVVTSRQITDAHLVNLAAGANTVLATLDRGIVELLAPSDRHCVLVLP